MKQRQPWFQAVIIKLIGPMISPQLLSAKLRIIWQIQRFYCVELGSGAFIVKFYNKEDRLKALEGGPWFIGGRFLFVRPLAPNYRPPQDAIGKIAVWIKLLELPVDFYDEESSQFIGNSLGKLLKIDTNCANLVSDLREFVWKLTRMRNFPRNS